jgi:two-component system cell cycle sensor histidine kinase PleC
LATGQTSSRLPNFGGTTGESVSQALDSRSMKTLSITAISFMVFFAVLASTVLLSERATHATSQKESVTRTSTDLGQSGAQALDTQLAWIDQAIATRGNAKEIVDLVARGKNVQGALIVDANNKLLAATPNTASAAASIPVKDFPKAGVKVTSLISPEGAVSPTVIRRAGSAYLATILAPGTMIDYTRAPNALILTGGGIIDAPAEMGKIGGLAYLGLSTNRLNAIKNNGAVSHNVAGKDVWMSVRTIPNSDSIATVSLLPKTTPPNWVKNILTFLTIFLGTGALFYILLKNLLRQLQTVESSQHNNEISEQRYRAALEGNRGGIFEINLTSNSAYLSSSLSEILGLAPREQEITLPQFLGLFREGDRERLYSVTRRAHIGGEFEIDLNVAHLPLTLAARGKPSVRGSDLEKVIIGVAMDVTEQRGAAMRLQAAEARLSDALTSMNDSFVLWDPRGRLTLWNRQFEKFFGFQPGNLQAGMERATIEYHANNVIAEINDIEGETAKDILLNDGRWIRYQDAVTADGGTVGIGTDLTGIRTREYQLQQNEAALQKTIDVLRKSQFRIVELAENYEQEKIRAEEANQSKSDFLANMSHELRTPLNAINGFSDIMKKEMFGPLGDPRYKEYVNDILFSGQHLLSLINDILDMSKIEAGKMTLNHEIMQIDDLIGQVIRIVRGRAEDNRLKLLYQPATMPEIEADPRAVKQVLLNLMTNAIKFTPEGGSVSCEVTPNSAGLIVKISDTGIGIAPEDIERLANPFEQIDSQHSRQHEGTGLGLALSKSMVELHGGNFKIESVLGQGTTVIFTLPNTPVEKAVVNAESEVGNEITRLAQDIADVLTDGSVNSGTPTTPVQEVPPQQNTQVAPPPALNVPPAPQILAQKQTNTPPPPRPQDAA